MPSEIIPFGQSIVGARRRCAQPKSVVPPTSKGSRVTQSSAAAQKSSVTTSSPADHGGRAARSARTAARLQRRSFRNWFRAGYPYIYAGFRLVR